MSLSSLDNKRLPLLTQKCCPTGNQVQCKGSAYHHSYTVLLTRWSCDAGSASSLDPEKRPCFRRKCEGLPCQSNDTLGDYMMHRGIDADSRPCFTASLIDLLRSGSGDSGSSAAQQLAEMARFRGRVSPTQEANRASPRIEARCSLSLSLCLSVCVVVLLQTRRPAGRARG